MRKIKEVFGEEIREKFAELMHEIWADWMNYMWENYDEKNEERWARQSKMLYKDLPEEEKESDRELAERIIMILKDYEIYPF